MRSLPVSCLLFCIAACASAPRGPTDAEVRAALDTQLQEMVSSLSAGNITNVVDHFVSDGVLIVRGVVGGDGQLINVEVAGPQQIQSFLNQAGAPPDFIMNVSAFERNGSRATQSGRWSIAGEQTGTFAIDWAQNADGSWQVVRWLFVGA